MGFPATGSGIEIRILKYLFSEDDARLFTGMTHQLETPEAVAARLGRPVEDLTTRLDDMAERGLLFRLKKQDASRYAAIPFVHGLFEFQVKTLDTAQNPAGMCNCCGLCVTTCPTDAITLVAKPEPERVVPPVTMMDQMVGRARKRGLI